MTRDYSYVPVPNPANYWPFEVGRRCMIGANCWFRVDMLHDTWIDGTEWLGNSTVVGCLHINEPMVIAQDRHNVPLVTLTLREIRDGKAFLQVTVRSDLPLGERNELN